MILVCVHLKGRCRTDVRIFMSVGSDGHHSDRNGIHTYVCRCADLVPSQLISGAVCFQRFTWKQKNSFWRSTRAGAISCCQAQVSTTDPCLPTNRIMRCVCNEGKVDLERTKSCKMFILCYDCILSSKIHIDCVILAK